MSRYAGGSVDVGPMSGETKFVCEQTTFTDISYSHIHHIFHQINQSLSCVSLPHLSQEIEPASQGWNEGDRGRAGHLLFVQE